MSIIQKIKNRFTRSNQKKDQNNYSTIQFLLDKENNSYVKIIFYDISDNTAKSFAEMLYDIMNGNHADQLFSLLSKMGQENEDMKYFIGQIFRHLSFMESEKNKKLLDPQVKPTDFLRSIKHET
jgi:hypothetical protein